MRQMEPDLVNGVVDDAAYAVLRPGVLIRSKGKVPKPEGERGSDSTSEGEQGFDSASEGEQGFDTVMWTSTSGVLVQDKYGDVFMTAASHAIGDDVFQLTEQGERRIGAKDSDIEHLDLALVQLDDSIRFDNEVFANTSGVGTNLSRLFGQDPADIFPADRDHAYMETPYTGLIEAVVKGESVAFPEGYDDDEHVASSCWTWHGQGMQFGPVPGVYGTPIWNRDRVVLGFFRYSIVEGQWRGWSVSLKADMLTRLGYKLCRRA